MQKMHDSLRHASKEGRLEFLQRTFELLADLHGNLEDKIVEKQENLDRAIWLHTSEVGIDLESKEAWMKLCEENLTDAQTQSAEFLSLLWQIKENPPDWLQKYREEMYYSESCPAEAAQSTLSEDGHPQDAAPSRPYKKAGRPPRAQEETIRRMNTDLDGEAMTEGALKGMAITSLANMYRVHHKVARKAREQVLHDRESARRKPSA